MITIITTIIRFVSGDGTKMNYYHFHSDYNTKIHFWVVKGSIIQPIYDLPRSFRIARFIDNLISYMLVPSTSLCLVTSISTVLVCSRNREACIVHIFLNPCAPLSKMHGYGL